MLRDGRFLGPLLAAFMLIGCTNEGPTAVGGGLVEGGLQTYEVTVPASVFLADDTTSGGFGTRSRASFNIVARDFDGVLDAHTLARFRPPASVTFGDSASDTQTDSMPSFIGGRVILVVDTIATTLDGPTEVAVYRIDEPWDPVTATWELRVDSAGMRVPWSEPGGPTDMLAGRAVLEPGMDTLQIEVDSATAVLWSDTTRLDVGALVRSETPGTRIRVNAFSMQFDARPEARPDTIVPGGGFVAGRTFVVDPSPAPPREQLRVGGSPGWRSVLRFRPLNDVAFSCATSEILEPDEVAADPCPIRLDQATINFAALRLQPVPNAGHRPESAIAISAHGVLETPGIPLFRSPLTRTLGQIQQAVPGTRFGGDAVEQGRIEIPITNFVRSLSRPATGEEDEEDPPEAVALLPLLENGLFGFATFASRDAAVNRPALRLVVSVVSEVTLR